MTKFVKPNTHMSIGGIAFEDCSNLAKVDILSADFVNGSQQLLFQSNASLTAVIIRRTDAVNPLPWSNAFSGTTPIANGTGYIYVPKALVNSYKAATNWSKWAAQFRAIEDYPEICGGE